MAKEKKHFKVNFKPINVKLKATRSQLKKIHKKVSKKHQKAITAQIKAIDVLLAACAGYATGPGPVRPPMSAAYSAK